MSCETELTWTRYVDGELPSEEVRRAEAHLVGCERCRRTVLALREETSVLETVLRERSLPGPLPALAEDPRAARGFAVGLPLALAGALVVTTVLGRLLELRPPAGTGWLHPSRLFGVNEMLFDVLFAVRDRAPGLVEFAVAVAATASVAVLVTFAAGAALRRVSGPVGLGLALALLALLPAGRASAALDVRHDERVRIAQDERIEESLLVTGESVEIDGVLVGDLFAFAERVEIRGRVEGNVFTGAKQLDLPGTVTGMVVAFGEDLSVEGSVEGGLYGAGDRLRLGRDASVRGDLLAAAGEMEIEGRVGRDLAAAAGRLELRGEIGRDVTAWLEEGRVDDGARIAGSLRAHAEDPEDLEVAAGAVVGGTVEVARAEHRHVSGFARYGHAGFYLWALVQLAMAFALGLGLRALFPALFGGRVESGREFFVALGVGFAALVVVPIALVLVGLTVVGLPIALIGLGVFLAALYLAGIQVAVLVGHALVRPEARDLRSFGLALLAGLAVLVVATRLPFVGGPLRALVLLVGLGLLAQRAFLWLRARPRGRALAAGA